MKSNKIKIKYILLYATVIIAFFGTNLITHRNYCKRIISTHKFLEKNDVNSEITMLVKNRSDIVIQTTDNSNNLTITFKGNDYEKIRSIIEIGDVFIKQKKSELITIIKEDKSTYNVEIGEKNDITCYAL